MNFTKQQKHEAYQKLSYDMQEFASSPDNTTIIETIASEHHLDAEHADVLDTEVYNTMIGLQTTTDMATNLKSALGLPELEVEQIVNALSSQIFVRLDYIKVGATGELPEHLVSTPTELQGATDVIEPPANLPTGNAEEKILPNVGTPGEKLAWEQRKQQVADKIVTESQYGDKDPYREPLK